MLETRTLVLDDDDAMLHTVVRCLRGTVRLVDEAIDCERALELFAAHRHSVVVLDLRMPKMDGFEVMQRIHEIDRRTQVIMVTGYASIEAAQRAVNLHAFGFLTKPFDFAELRDLVVAAFADYQQRSTRQGQRHPSVDLDAEIEELYRQVASASSALERSPDDPELQAAYRESFGRLRSAQAHEADLASRAFRDNLALKKGIGYSSIEAARRVLDRDKDSA
jgi:DNA-binding NtrC family response regulator